MKNLKLILIFLLYLASGLVDNRASATSGLVQVDERPADRTTIPKASGEKAKAWGATGTGVKLGGLLAKEVNAAAERFVNRANDWIVRRSEVDAELDRGLRAIANACASRQSGGDIGQGQNQLDRGQVEGIAWKAQLKSYEAEIESLKLQFSDRIKIGCGVALRAPGFRSESCLVLEMSEQWANQTELFIKLQSRSADREESLMAQLSAIGTKACMSHQSVTEVQQKMIKISKHLNQGSQALIKDTLQQLIRIASEARQ